VRKICIVISQLGGGGAERVVASMANYWAGKGWDISIASLADDTQPPAYELNPRIGYTALGVAHRETNSVWNPMNFLRLWRLRKAIAETSPDVVISHIDKVNIAVLIATIGLRIPIVVTEHIDPLVCPLDKVWHTLRRLTYPLAERIVVLTQRSVECFPERMRGRVEVIPNAVVLRIPNRVEQMERGFTGHTIVGMGRLCPQKGFDLLLQAFSLVEDRHPQWTVTIIGEGPDRAELEALRDELGLTGRVSFPGWMDQPHAFLMEADLFVMPSRFEGFPLALCEAMACGLPVIASDCRTGPREIVQDDTSGVLVPPEDVDALARAMDRLMSNETEREKLGTSAAKVRESLSLEAVMGMWENLLDDVPSRAAGSSRLPGTGS
jgi:GalNAc-alpha-(1->4)-GalNAc-alpha-(1->3)-diNAcBac-PP-undecaprenol alpha-1,4-N-acetyl-D-galactosaminyltransferase